MSFVHAPRRRAVSIMLAAALGLSVIAAAPIVATVEAPPAAAATAIPTGANTNPFVSRKGVYYRIPALAYAPVTHTLYAFAERRDNNTDSDKGNFDIDLATSTDYGKSWKVRTIVNEGKWQSGSPSATVAADGKTVVLVAYWHHPVNGVVKDQLQVRTSADGFRGRLDIPISTAYGQPGPGTGILYTKGYPAGKGRILVPLSYHDNAGRRGARFLISDDNGRHWTGGAPAYGPSSGSAAVIEPQAALLANGQIYLGMRDKSAKAGLTNRYYTYANADGRISTSWKRLSFRMTSVQASFVSPTSGPYAKTLFMVGPSTVDKKIPLLRRDEAIWASTDYGKTWHKPYQLNLDNRPSAYSAIVQMGDTLGVLYETGTKTWRERIHFTSVRIATAAHWKKVASAIATKQLSRGGAWVQVRAKGATSPWGVVRLTWTNVKTHKSGHVSKTLISIGKGKAYVHLPKLKKGKYKIVASYLGTGRIATSKHTAGTITIR